jgi:hypothetical protein
MFSVRSVAMLLLTTVPLAACSSDDPAIESDPGQAMVDPPNDAGKAPRDGGRDAARPDARTPPVIKPDPLSDADTSCGSVREEAQFERGPVDILLAIDTSGSMAPYVCNTSTNLTAFAAAVGTNSHVVAVYQMDALLGLLTAGLCGNADPLASTPLAMDPTRYLQRTVMVDSWNALTRLSGEFDGYKDFLRPDAPTHIVVVTDDNSTVFQGGITAADFKAQMEEKLGHGFTFHSIVADGQNGCVGTSVGTEYLSLSDETGGEKLPICSQDWSMMFEKLQEAVVATVELPCDFAIPPNPAGESVDFDAVQVVFEPSGGEEQQIPRTELESCGDRSAWHFDNKDAPTRIVLCPTACEAVKKGGNVNIAFGCAPEIII